MTSRSVSGGWRSIGSRCSYGLRSSIGYRVVLLVVALWALPATTAAAASKVTGSLLVKDALTIPNRPARIEARLIQHNLVGEIGLGGESLQLEIAGKAVGTAMTGGDGRAYFEYTPKMRGNVTFAVTLPNSPRVEASRAAGLLAVWEHRRPILLVESVALVEQPSELPALPFGKPGAAEIKPSPDAAEELGRMAQFYYNVMYVAAQNEGPFSAAKVGQFRQWLGDNGFPTGFILHTTITSEGLGATLDELKKEGWTAMKAGIGRSTAFAATLVERRMEAVLVPEPSKGEVPRKTKTAKDWKDVRKKL